jgi:hypothetical protein
MADPKGGDVANNRIHPVKHLLTEQRIRPVKCYALF